MNIGGHRQKSGMISLFVIVSCVLLFFSFAHADIIETVAVKAPFPMKVDCEFSEWKEAVPIFLNRREQLALYNYWKGPMDSSATFYFMWDEENLYVAVKVVDDHIVWSELTMPEWHDYGRDFFRIYLDCKHTRTQRLTETDYAFIIFPRTPSEGPKKMLFAWTGGCGSGGYEHTEYDLNQVKLALKFTQQGYDAEMAIPLNSLQGFPKQIPGSTVGLQLWLGDCDDPEDTSKTWQHEFTWSQERGDMFWCNPSKFGNLLFVTKVNAEKIVKYCPNILDISTNSERYAKGEDVEIKVKVNTPLNRHNLKAEIDVEDSKRDKTGSFLREIPSNGLELYSMCVQNWNTGKSSDGTYKVICTINDSQGRKLGVFENTFEIAHEIVIKTREEERKKLEKIKKERTETENKIKAAKLILSKFPHEVGNPQEGLGEIQVGQICLEDAEKAYKNGDYQEAALCAESAITWFKEYREKLKHR